MDNKIIYCFDKSYKKDLISHGYTFVQDGILFGKDVSMFLNDGCKLDFSLDNKTMLLSNKMYF